VRVVSCAVLFVLCVCVCDMFLLLQLVVSIAAPALYFGSVVLAEETEISLVVSNRGALPTRCTVRIAPIAQINSKLRQHEEETDEGGDDAQMAEVSERAEGATYVNYACIYIYLYISICAYG